MAVPVVGIRVMRMAVVQRFMLVPMGMLPFEGGEMHMRVVATRVGVCMQVLVVQRLMAVGMGVVFRQVQPDAERHQQRGGQQRPCDRLGQKNH